MLHSFEVAICNLKGTGEADTAGEQHCILGIIDHGARFAPTLQTIARPSAWAIELGCPWQNGRIERLFLTLKEKLNHVIPQGRDALDSLLHEFAFWYNEVRPHQHLHGFTPAEVWRGIDPYRSIPKEVLAFEGWNGMLKGYWLRR